MAILASSALFLLNFMHHTHSEFCEDLGVTWCFACCSRRDFCCWPRGRVGTFSSLALPLDPQ